jgi:hypothetical protein
MVARREEDKAEEQEATLRQDSRAGARRPYLILAHP